MSETVFDLGDDLLACDAWDPTTLPSPYADVIPTPQRLEDDVPFGIAEEADVSLDESCTCGVDGYIDDGITVALNTPETKGLIARAAQAVTMALFLIFRPLAKTIEAIVRPDILSVRKMLAEGGLHELVIFLGWSINTRRLTVALPEDKYLAYSSQIEDCINDKRSIPGKKLKTLVGRLNHVCFVIPDGRHFMNRLRALQESTPDAPRPRHEGRPPSLAAFPADGPRRHLHQQDRLPQTDPPILLGRVGIRDRGVLAVHGHRLAIRIHGGTTVGFHTQLQGVHWSRRRLSHTVTARPVPVPVPLLPTLER